MRSYSIAPSILSADFSNLAKEIALAEEGGAKLIHIDVMDGHFVPNITIGPLVVEAVNRVTTLPLDVHLMIENPDQLIESFVLAGADMISVHVEGAVHLHRSIGKIRSFPGVQAGAAVNPATPLSTLEHVLGDLDFVLLMTVNPGFGGQEFIPSMLQKIAALKAMIENRGLKTKIEVDGGINVANIKSVFEAGCDIMVAGSAVFSKRDPIGSLKELETALDK